MCWWIPESENQIPKNPGWGQQRLASLNLRPEYIGIVLVTHLHVDHIGGAFDPASGRSVLQTRNSSFPRPRLSSGANRIRSWEMFDNSPLELIHLTIQCAQQALSILGNQTKSFKAGAELLPAITGIALPGDTPGLTGFDFKSGGEEFLAVGDPMHHPILHLTYPKWISLGDSSRAKTAETRRTLLSRLARGTGSDLSAGGFLSRFPGLAGSVPSRMAPTSSFRNPGGGKDEAGGAVQGVQEPKASLACKVAAADLRLTRTAILTLKNASAFYGILRKPWYPPSRVYIISADIAFEVKTARDATRCPCLHPVHQRW